MLVLSYAEISAIAAVALFFGVAIGMIVADILESRK